jgi:hypothetical protein
MSNSLQFKILFDVIMVLIFNGKIENSEGRTKLHDWSNAWLPDVSQTTAALTCDMWYIKISFGAI